MTDLTQLPADEARTLIRQAAAEAVQEANARAASRPPATTTAQQAGAPSTPLEDAQAALRAEVERAEHVEAARALVRARGREAGYAVTGEHLTDEEALRLAGLAPEAETPAQRRVREEDAIWAEGGAPLAELARKKAIQKLNQEWWMIDVTKREAKCAELGLDFEAVRSAKDAEMRKGDSV